MTVGTEGDDMVCPACESARVDGLDALPGGFTHRCADCGATFDEAASRVTFPDEDS